MKSATLVLALSFWITIEGKMHDKTLQPYQKTCFTCDSLSEGTIFCDDFESETSLADRYFEYDNNWGDFVRVQKAGRNGSAGMRVVWQPGEVAAGRLKNLSEKHLMTI